MKYLLNKFTYALTSYSPIFLSVWIVKAIQNFNDLHWLDAATNESIWINMRGIIIGNWPLYIIGGCMSNAYYILSQAENAMPPKLISLKEGKSVGLNFGLSFVVFSLPFIKLAFSNMSDYLYLGGVFCIWLIFSLLSTNLFELNLVIRLLGYRQYKVQTQENIFLLMLSKNEINLANENYLPINDRTILASQRAENILPVI